MTETLLHRWFEEVWNKKNKAAIREMLTEDAVHYGLMDLMAVPLKASRRSSSSTR